MLLAVMVLLATNFFSNLAGGDVINPVVGDIIEKAKEGDAKEQYTLGRIYFKGFGGVDKDPVEAVKWYRKAAEQGHVDAQFYLGSCYQRGNGVDKDQVEAVKWYRKAAEQGHVDAQCILGLRYEKGNGVDKDQVEAVKWYRKAAEQGHVDAQTKLRKLGY